MPPAQQFWNLLLGDQMAATLSLRENAKNSASRVPAGAREPREPDAAHDMRNDGGLSNRLGPQTFPSKSQPIAVPDLNVEGVLQMAGDELCRQPALLHMEAEKIANAQDELAVQNCSLFLASSKALNSLRCSIESLSATLAETEQCVQPLHDGLKQFRAESNQATSREGSLHILVSMQRSVSELFDLPSLVLNCCNGGLYDEAVDVLIFADEKLASLRANGCCNMRLLDSLASQLKEARRTCVKAMLRQLGQHVQLAASIKLVGPLRRLSCSEGQLRAHFLQRRDVDIACQRRNAEAACKTKPARGLCAAAELLRLDVLQTGVHYRAIFGTTDGPLAAWLAEQVHWYVKLVRHELLQGTSEVEALEALDTGGSAIEPAALDSTVAQRSRGHASKFRIGLVDLATVYRQAYSAAWALRRVRCFFFPAVALAFDRYVVAMHRRTLEEVAGAFAQSLDNYDYVPAALYFMLLEGTPWFQSFVAANPCCVFLLRHTPLANLYNSIAEMLNSFQECSISTAASGIASLLAGLFVFCIRKLASVKQGNRVDFQDEIHMIEQNLIQRKLEREDTSTRQAEFFVMCDVFACVLVPTISKHISTIFPSLTAFSPKNLFILLEEAELYTRESPFAEACSALSSGSAVAKETKPDP